jgi:hypothetical protein
MPTERYASLCAATGLSFGLVFCALPPMLDFVAYSALTALLLVGTGAPLLVIGALLAFAGLHAWGRPQGDAASFVAPLVAVLASAVLVSLNSGKKPCVESSQP